ncbi:hypothetical protein A5721_22980 [Mycobacterium vulneris]|nr:hypothetical protein A5721_22980 [Mycolicibacterium vulneris]
MPTATTNSYDVDYVHIDTVAKVPEVITLMLGIHYNVDLNAHRTITAQAVPPSEDNPDGTPEQYVDELSMQISRNGLNQVTANIGTVLVWDRGVL